MRYHIQIHLCLHQKHLIKDNNRKMTQQALETGYNLLMNKMNKIIEYKDRN